MSEENPNENEEVVDPQDGVGADPSSAETQDKEATLTKATEPKEPPFNEHPRWKELQEERRELREQNQKLQEQLVQIVNNSKPTQSQIEEKISEANTPEEREFWQKVEKIADSKSEAKIRNLVENFEREKKVIYDTYGQLASKEFLKEHPNVKKGSEELKEIVNKARVNNLDLEDAYKIVMFDREKEAAAEGAKREKQQQNQKKLAANVERGTVSKEAPINKTDDDFDTVFNNLADESGLFK
jgi:hypothetical protein